MAHEFTSRFKNLYIYYKSLFEFVNDLATPMFIDIIVRTNQIQITE